MRENKYQVKKNPSNRKVSHLQSWSGKAVLGIQMDLNSLFSLYHLSTGIVFPTLVMFKLP